MCAVVAILQFLSQCRFFWCLGEGGVSWARVPLWLGSACLANLAPYFLGVGSAHSPLGLTIGVLLASVIAPLVGAICVAMAGGLLRQFWCV